MKFEYPRAFLLGALLWVLIFFEVSVLMFGFKMPDNIVYYITQGIILLFLVGVVAWWYFSRRHKTGSFGEGVLVGLVFVLAGIVLDAALTIPLFTHDYETFFTNPYLWASYLETVLIVGVVGFIKRK